MPQSSHKPPSKRNAISHAALIASASVLGMTMAVGCSSSVKPLVDHDQHAEAVAKLDKRLAKMTPITDDIRTGDSAELDRSAILIRSQYMIPFLADGNITATERPVDEFKTLLEARGINQGKRRAVDAILFEGATQLWRGEPFEQQMAHLHIGLYSAMLAGVPGEDPVSRWGEAGNAATRSLFAQPRIAETLPQQIKTDDGTIRTRPDTMNQQELLEWIALDTAARNRSLKDNDDKDTQQSVIDDRFRELAQQAEAMEGDPANRSLFVPGYILRDIAAIAGGAADRSSWRGAPDFSDAVAADRELYERYGRASGLHMPDIAKALNSHEVNTILFVDYGETPKKKTDRWIFSKFDVKNDLDNRRIVASVLHEGESQWQEAGRLPWAFDVNEIANDYLWTGYEDIRKAKALVGAGLLAGGFALIATADDSKTQRNIGIASMIVGGFQLMFSRADTRQNDVLPERIYVVPLALQPNRLHQIRLEVEGDPDSTLVLGPMMGPSQTADRLLSVRYVRLPNAGEPIKWAKAEFPSDWDNGGEITPALPDDRRPLPGTVGHKRVMHQVFEQSLQADQVN